jgi:hypothetical protein
MALFALAIGACAQGLGACASGLHQPYELREGEGGEGGGACSSIADGPTALVSGAFAGEMDVGHARTIVLLDLDGDGLAEICGYDGHQYACHAQREPCDANDEPTWVVPLDTHWQAGAPLHFGDMDGNGRVDLCIRKPDGIWCALQDLDVSTGSLEPWSSAFSDADEWSEAQYSATVQLVDIDTDGDADICGRGPDGLVCVLSSGSGAGAPIIWSVGDEFSDIHTSLSEPESYLTLRFVDVDGDGYPDACLGLPGVQCAINKSPGEIGFDAVTQWASLTAHSAWAYEQYWKTIQYPDIDGDGQRDMCGRGDRFLYCARSLGTTFEETRHMLPELADDQGWNREIRYLSLHVVDVDADGRPDVCGRDESGLVCAWSLESLPVGDGTFFGDLEHWSDAFADDGDFEDDPSQWRTLQTAEIDGTPGLEWCARRRDGIHCTR